jgi:AmmeMemoRadiSam system protein B
MKGQDGKQVMMLGLADAQQISPKMVATSPAVQSIIPLLDGSRTLDEVASQVGRGLTREFLEPFVAQLDDAGLIVGPVFEAMFEEMKAKFDEAPTLPPGATAQFADQLVMAKFGAEATDQQKQEHGGTELRAVLDTWIGEVLKQSKEPGFDRLPTAVVAPHIDYPRGWMNYAQVYGRLKGLERPDRVLVLGTNHFGDATGVCGCDKGFESPLGVSEVAGDLLSALKAELGEEGSRRLLANRYDHEREHSVELHIPWIQHAFGEEQTGRHVPVMGVLIHDPTVNGGESYDGNGVGLEEFVSAMRAALDKVGGTTLIVSSADLSHAGPAFGDQQPLGGDSDEAKAARARISEHDREMLAHVLENRPDDLVASMSWQQNPTRWCSIGNLVATLRLVQPERVRMIGYAAAVDQQGVAMVSHAAMAMS